MSTSIKCPGCETGEIIFDAHLLLSGNRFKCNHCNASICLSDSAKSTLEDSLAGFDQMKKSITSVKRSASKPKVGS